MVDVWLPYGKSEVCLRIPTRNFLGSIEPRDMPGVADVRVEVESALSKPIGSKKLGEIVRPEQTVVIVVNDATKKTPSQSLVLPILSELNAAGVKDEKVTIIFACGSHRAVKQEEAVRLLGEDILSRVKTVSNDSSAQDLVYVGTTERGTKVYLNRVFAQADVRILTGEVGLHYFAGYDGGRSSVLPGVVGNETIKRNHAMFLDSNARAGILEGNPVHEDMAEAAKMAKVDFIVNVVTNSRGDVVRVFAGDLNQAFYEAVKVVDEMCKVAVDRRADVVVVSAGGNPHDANLSQACKCLEYAMEVVKRGGTVILVAESPEGHGNQAFYDWMARFGDLKSVEKEIRRNFALGGHKAYYLLHALQNHRLILVSSMPDYYAAGIFKFKTARAVNDALNEAFSLTDRSGRVWTMPYGHCTLPEVKVAEEQAVPASV